MRQRTVRYLAHISFGVATTVILVLGWVLYHSTLEARASTASVSRTLEVLAAVDQVNEKVARAESAQRGYVLTADESYRADRDEAMARAIDSLSVIKHLTSESASQQGRVEQLGKLLAERLAIMHAGEQILQPAGSNALDLSSRQRARGRAASQRIYQLTGEMQQEEQQLLRLRREQERHGYDRTMAILVAVVVVGLAILVACYAAFVAQSRARVSADRKLRDMANSLPGAAYRIRSDPDGHTHGRLEFVSASVVDLFGVPREALLQSLDRLYERVLPEDRASLAAAIERCERTGEPLRHDFRVTNTQGATIWIRGSANVRRQPDGAVIWNGFWLNVTEQRLLEAALLEATKASEDAKVAAEAANQAKSRFLATISHEIRTPMNAVLGLLELLSYSILDEEQRETVALAQVSSGSLLRLIDDILDFSKIEAGKLEIHCEPTRLRDVVDQVIHMFGGVASAKGLTLRCAFGPGVPEHVSVDALRLRQILGNFLSNAIKFTKQGTIGLEVNAAPEPDKPDLVRFAVTDGGIGMDQETIARLCQPFVQADARTSRRYGGSGLGLAICQRLAELMSGRLHIDSSPGKGTTVSVVLSLPPAQVKAPDRTLSLGDTQSQLSRIPARIPSVEAAAKAGQLILVVDDHPTNRRLLVRQLAWLGYASEAAANGAQALVLFGKRRAAGTPHALIITDLQMPEMDGYELAQRIRRLTQADSERTVITAFTANNLREARDQCLAAGMDDVLTKPIDLAHLRVKLEGWLPLRGSPAKQEKQTGREPPLSQDSQSPQADGGMTAEFCLAHEEDIEMLHGALRERRYDSVARAAHRIKGAAGMFGDEGLAEAAAQLEQLASDSHTWEATETAAGHVIAQTEQLFLRIGWVGRRRSA